MLCVFLFFLFLSRPLSATTCSKMRPRGNPIIIIIISGKENDIQMIPSRVNRLRLVSSFLISFCRLYYIFISSFFCVCGGDFRSSRRRFIVLVQVVVFIFGSFIYFFSPARLVSARNTDDVMRKWALCGALFSWLAHTECGGWSVAAAQPIRYACL